MPASRVGGLGGDRDRGEALVGVRVVVTRPVGAGAERLVAAFKVAGATVDHLPLLEIVPADDPRPLERAATELPLYDWVGFSSAHAVGRLLEACGGTLPDRLRLAAVGTATAEALAAFGITADLVAGEQRAEGLAEALAPHVTRSRVLLPQAADARPVLAERLRRAGAEVSVVIAYDKRLPASARDDVRVLFSDRRLGWVTFTSPSAFHNFVHALGPLWTERRGELLAASIGPVTSAALREAAVEPACEASMPSVGALVGAVVARVGARS